MQNNGTPSFRTVQPPPNKSNRPTTSPPAAAVPAPTMPPPKRFSYLANQPLPPKQLLTLAATLKYCDISRTSIYRWVDMGQFPPPRRMGERWVRWALKDIQAWIDGKRDWPGEPGRR